jgi:hypothetical protein
MFFAEWGEAVQVGKQNRDGLLSTVEFEIAGISEKAVTHTRGNNAAKGLTNALTFDFKLMTLSQVFKDNGCAFGIKVRIA